MQKIDKFAHAIKVVALCLPPVVMSLIGLAGLSRKKGGAALLASKRPSPTPAPCDPAVSDDVSGHRLPSSV
jgi:hypothetical protein